MGKLSRKRRGRRKPHEIGQVLKQLPPDSPDREAITNFMAQRGEWKKFQADCRRLSGAGHQPDPREAMKLAVSTFAAACEAELTTVHDVETALEFERSCNTHVKEMLGWFARWLRTWFLDADTVSRELYPQLNEQLLAASDDAQATAWHSLRAAGAETAELIALMSKIEKWRLSAGQDGGKLMQVDVARMMNMDRRDYTAAMKGTPRAKDHPGRIRKFAADKGIIIILPDSAK